MNGHPTRPVDAPRRRLRPTRAGIVGLWDYGDAVFRFADGRLVLRGANGSGKTKALEVLFPFVLDGRLDPRRLDPFSGENRTMKENLLWRGGDTGHGFAWLEFGDDHRTVTVGVGLQAQRHRADTRSWFFLTDRHVGEDDLRLVDPDGRPRTKRAIADELGDGAVLDKASDHRRRVDDALFGLGEERYEAMLDLILTLRRPMLAKDLDPRLLSETLTRGLRPLDEDLIADVARSFDDLEAVQRDLDRMIAADDAARAFVTDYRGYLRTQARHRADATIEAQAAATAADDRRRRAAEALDDARAAEAMTEAEAAAVTDRLARDRARHDALRSSEAFQAASQLQHLERSVADLAQDLERARARERDTAHRAGLATQEAERAADAAERTAAEVTTQQPRVARAADAAGIDWSADDGAAPHAEVATRVRARVAARRADVTAVRAALAAVADADRRVELTEQALEDAEVVVRTAEAAHGDADTAVTTARGELTAAVRAWADARPDTVDAEDAEVVLAAVADVGEPDAPTPQDALRERLAPRIAAATDERTRATVRRGDLDDQRRALDERRTAILEERDDAPPAVPWRTAPREDRAGAPLWRLVRFADDIDPTAAAGIEAGLEATGLLDAWVAPDGQLLGDLDDAFLVTADGDGDGPADAAGERGPTLADVLEVEDQPHVDAEVVRALLRRVALHRAASAEPSADGDPDAVGAAGSDDVASEPEASGHAASGHAASGHAASGHAASEPGASAGPAALAGSGGRPAIGTDGSYRTGPLAGRHRVAGARYLGATARAAHRATRVAALDEELAAVAAELAGVDEQLADLDRWLTAADEAQRSVPDDQRVRAALRDRDLAAARWQQARDGARAARERAEAARRSRNEQRSALQREARTRGLPADADAVETVAQAVDTFADDGGALVTALERAAVRRDAADDAVARARRASDDAQAARDDAAERRRRHDARAVELTTLREQMGADAQTVLDEVAAVARAIEAGEDARTQLATQLQTAAATRGQAEGELRAASEAVEVAAAAVEATHDHLRLLARPDIAAPLGLEVAEDVDAEVLLTAVDELVVGVSGSEERRKAARTIITRGVEQLDHALGAAYRPRWDVDDDVIVVAITDDAGERPLAAFADQLARQRAEQEALLTERERSLFEDALLTSVCGQIHARTHATRDLVAAMDQQMRARRLSSGQTVGVAWRPDDTATPEWTRVHRLLDQDPAHFGPDQLELLRRHFAAEIAAARAADPQAPYRELLTEVLDYRRWRRFELSLVEADGSQAVLTRARHARLSGGEKAASLHLPLFAAAHAAFGAGRADAPRLLGLDEAFAGIDDTGRSELLSLSVAFDLDLFMTGYDLWAVDRTVPGVAHYDLLHLPDAHTVSALLVLWDGHELREGADAEEALSSVGARAGSDPGPDRDPS